MQAGRGAKKAKVEMAALVTQPNKEVYNASVMPVQRQIGSLEYRKSGCTP